MGTDRVIFTLVEFETAEVLKGNAGVTVTLQFLGGTVEGVTLEVADVPRFNPGTASFFSSKVTGSSSARWLVCSTANSACAGTKRAVATSS